MDLYGLPAPECFRIDDLLDFSNDELFSVSTTTGVDSNHHYHLPSLENGYPPGAHSNAPIQNQCPDFTDDLCVPSDDIAELEWLSNFVDDSFKNFPANELAGMINLPPEASFQGRSRSKRSRAASANNGWASSAISDATVLGKPKANGGKKRENLSSSSTGLTGDRSSPSSSETSPTAVRRCTHCASEKTPQWRTGPLGPKTLCNACGVRYKSGRLVPEYRPAASPTFVLTQHSNSHRKVMEIRRQKEILRQQQQHQHQHQHQQQQRQIFHHHRNFEVC
ncbi:hypothetical protein NMG60_11029181 [Bertholletia excelsa]